VQALRRELERGRGELRESLALVDGLGRQLEQGREVVAALREEVVNREGEVRELERRVI
jgi:hypothetical protein